jgi:hypothetical protein
MYGLAITGVSSDRADDFDAEHRNPFTAGVEK